MAWYSLYKWCYGWSNRKSYNMIYWYNEYILKTPEQRQKEYLERKQKTKQLLTQLTIMHTMLN